MASLTRLPRTASRFIFVRFMGMAALAAVALLGGSSGFAQQLPDLPPDAVAMLKTFPGEKITLDLVVGRAIEASDSFEVVKASLVDLDAPLLRAESLLDPRLSASYTRIDNSNEAESPFSPNRMQTSSYELSLSKYFQTGTTAAFEFSHGSDDLRFLTFPGFFTYQTRAGISLTQNLWQDAFGYGGGRSLKAGRLLQSAAKSSFEENVQNWMIELVELYYAAWLAQTQAKAAVDNVKRRQRFLDVTRLKSRRGTAELPDVLQVESAYLNAQVEAAAARQRLGDRWRALVVPLKFPVEWLSINPANLPVETDEAYSTALQACSQAEPQQRASTERARLQAEAAELLYERAKNAAAPDLELVGSLYSNGVDQVDRSVTFSETFRALNPAWTIGLQLSMPLSRDSEKADAMSALADQLRSSARQSSSKSDLKLEWMNNCQDLARLQEAQKLSLEAYNNQARRLEAEEARFRIGRSTTLQVIQAGDDAMQAQLNLSNIEASLRVTGWRVQALSDGLKGYLKSLGVRQ